MSIAFIKSVFEGVLKIALFLGYVILCSRMEEMKRVFMYHGAEHKTIFCYEADEELLDERNGELHPDAQGDSGAVVGRNAVRELLNSGMPVDKILVSGREGSVVALIAQAKEKKIPVVDADSADWTVRAPAGTAEFADGTYNVYMYRYKAKLAPDTETSDVITAAYMAPELDYQNGKFVMNGTVIENYTPGEKIEIYVAAQAIQADGFEDYDSALNNFTTHPWAN